MSYNAIFKRLSVEAAKLNRREVQLQLSRYVETYQVVSNPTEADFPDLYKFMQIVTILTRQDEFRFTDKELAILVRLYILMRRDCRSSVLGPVHLAELILLQERYRVTDLILTPRNEPFSHVIDYLPILLPPCRPTQFSHVVQKISNFLASPLSNMQTQLDVILSCPKFIHTEYSRLLRGNDTASVENVNGSMNNFENIKEQALKDENDCSNDKLDKIIPDDVMAALLNHVLQTLRLPGMMQGAQPVSLRQSSSKEANRRRTSDKATTELDGTDCIDRFTILNLANIYTPEQLMHMEVFPVLKRWLLAAINMKPKCNSNSNSPGNRKEFLGEVICRLREDVTELIQRLLEQCDRPVTRISHRDQVLMESCLLEAIDLLELAIILEPHSLTRLYRRVLAIFEKQDIQTLRGDMPTVMVRLMDFLVTNGKGMGVGLKNIVETVYREMILAGYYMDPLFVDELMRYTLERLEELSMETENWNKSPLKSYFPNLWKLLAWNPRALLSRFMDLLPAFLGEGMALENLHTILDVPCLSASLEFKRQIDTGECNQDQRLIWNKLLGYFNFILRAESGRGDTLDRMQDLYCGLECLQRHPRVLYACDVVTPLLTVYFKVVLEFGDEVTLSEMVPIILDRSLLLYGPPEYKAGVQEALGNALQALVALRPELVGVHETELLEHLSKVSNISRAPSVYVSVLHVVGKFSSSISNTRTHASDELTSELNRESKPREESLRRFYETIECLTYELLSEGVTCPNVVDYPFWCITVITLAKIASQMPDYAPRCLLCLSKIRIQVPRILPVNEEGRKALSQRVGELSQLLRNPNIGPHVLCPRPDILRQFTAHRDPGSLAVALKEVDRRMVEPNVSIK